MTETVFRLAFAILLAALMGMRVYYMIKVRRSGGRLMPDKTAVEREGGGIFLFVRIIFFLALIVFLIMYFAGMAWIGILSIPLPGWLRWIGFVLGLFAVAFWTWAQIYLDTRWSAQLQLTQGHRLVTGGPYALVRHPLYAGMFAWAVAVMLLTANWIFAAVCVLSIAGTLWRIPKEEQMMIEAFGDEYTTYMRRTGRLIPRIGK